jgi:hypothetical protein
MRKFPHLKIHCNELLSWCFPTAQARIEEEKKATNLRQHFREPGRFMRLQIEQCGSESKRRKEMARDRELLARKRTMLVDGSKRIKGADDVEEFSARPSPVSSGGKSFSF